MSEPTNETKIVCPHCGQHILIEASMLGTELQCPACNQSFTAPKADATKEKPPENNRTPASRNKGKSGIALLKSTFAYAWRHVKSSFLRLPERVQGAVLASAVFLVVIGVCSGKDESRDSKNTSPPEPAATTTQTPLPRLDIQPLSADPAAGQWIRSCQEGDFKEVLRHPERYEGAPLFIQGKISRVYSIKNHRGAVRIEQDGDWKREWAVVFDDERTVLPDGNMLEDDEVCVFGTFEKIWEWTGKNALNATISGKNPRIIARLITTDDPDDVAESYAGEDEEREDDEEEDEEREEDDEEDETTDEDDHRGVREPTAAERTFREGLDALRGENGQKRNVAKAYRLFQKAENDGCMLGEVGIAHICWTMTDDERQTLKKTGITPLTLYFANWRHAAEMGKSRIAKCELGLFQLQRDAYRNEGLRILKEAAAEGSDTAAMFLSRVAEQEERSSLSYETILGLFAKNSEIMALFQKACEVELAKEYLLSLKSQP